jgi:competence protein ComGC/RNA polymerase subunit RPABC4/transcription elongation factor Spt4
VVNCAVCNEKLNSVDRFCRNCGSSKEIVRPLLVLDSKTNQRILTNKRSAFTFIEALISLFVICVLSAIAIPSFRKCYRSQAYDKACASNMRVLLGAIEMYNMDNPNNFLRYLRPVDYGPSGILVKEKYLKSPIRLPKKDCDYLVSGDLTKDGHIFCPKHGSAENVSKSREFRSKNRL